MVQTGSTSTVDLTPALASRHLFTALRTDDDLFASMMVTDDGTGLEWPDGAELSAAWIERLDRAT